MKQINYTFKPIFFKKIHENAITPTIAHEGDVGYDLYPLEDIDLLPGKTTICKTGIQLTENLQLLIHDNKVLAVPFLKIEGRSGLASKGIFPVGGIIDPSYRGEIGVILYNSTNEVYKLTPRKAMAQLIAYCTISNCSPYITANFLESENNSNSERGTNGFGSSDKT